MMDITIYQVNIGRDNNRVAFQSFDELERLQGSSKIDSEIYDRVFDGEVDCKDLEAVYEMFNINYSDGYRCRSLSVSDVIEVRENGKSTFHYCDSFGYKDIEFDPDLTTEHKEEEITVVLCEPGKLAKITEINNSLESLQTTVGGNIEPFYPFEEPVCIICNDEGKFNGMDLNRAVYGENKEIIDIIAGPFFICDCSGENFGSLNKEQQERFKKQFKNPERFFKMGNEIKAIPYEPVKNHER